MKIIKIVVIASTRGSLIKELIKYNIKDRIYEVISDRSCEAIKIAKKNKIKNYIFKTNNKKTFSNFLYRRYKNKKIDYFFLFYTKKLIGNFIKKFKNKIINSHPALLPKYKGLGAFEKNYFSKVKNFGPTIHFIDKNIDTGPIISKIILKKNRWNSFAKERNRVFIKNKFLLLQFIKNAEQNLIKIYKNKVYIISRNKKKYPNNIENNLSSYFLKNIE